MSAANFEPRGRHLADSNRAGIVAVDNLQIKSDGIDLVLAAGTILGLAGPPAGSEALMEALTGVSRRGKWSIKRNGLPVHYARPSSAARDGVGFVSGDRANKGILANLPIVDNLAASARVVAKRRMVRNDEIAQANELFNALSIRAASLWDLPASLSGGTQQKLLIARWLRLKPRVLVLEEPTRGVDIRTKHEIYALIRAMAADGAIIVWWSTEYVELVELCDTVLAFDPDGHPTHVLNDDAITETGLANATGMAA